MKGQIMRSDTGPSWLIRDDEAYLLQLALYVRDACQLLVAMHPSIPPLHPPIAPITSELATVNTTEAAEQWNAWWQELLQQQLTDTKTVDLKAAHAFPDFAALANRPDLQASVRLCFRQATGWINARMRELIPTILSANRADSAQEVVRELEHEQGRSVNAFRLRIIALPVQGKHAWSMTPSSAIMSYEFRFDSALYSNWLRAAVAALAF